MPFYPPYNLENQNFQKIKKASWDVIILHMCTKNHDHNDVWLLRYEMRPTELLCHFGPFLHFYHPKNPKNKNFEKIKKISEDIIILQLCTTNDIHMMNGFWNIEKTDKILSFWTIFCPFTPLTTWKIKILVKLMKTSGYVII